MDCVCNVLIDINKFLINILLMDQFIQCQTQFERLVAKGLLPTKMKAKLKYIQSSILDKHNPEESSSILPDFERLSLQEMNKQTQKAFFINIIRCFVSSQYTEHFKNVKVKIKIKGSSDSNNYYLTCIGSRLKVLKSKSKEEIWRQFSMETTKITSTYQEVKKKYTFNIQQDKVEYQLCFDKETTCARIHSLIQNLICERNPNHKYQSQHQSQREEEQQPEHDFNEEENIINQEIEHMKTVRKTIQVLISNEDKFKLYKNLQNGKIQVNTENNSVRLLLFIQKCDMKRYIQCFVMFDCWNTQVDTFKIIKRIRSNSYLAYIKLKRYNIWTSQRQAYIVITYLKQCKCLFDGESYIQRKSLRVLNRQYIIIQNVEYQEIGHKKGTPMSFNQVIQFTEVEECKDKIFLNLLSNVDFGTFQLLAHKSQININLLKDVQFLAILYKEQSIQNNSQLLFQHDHCACTIKNEQKRLALKVEEPDSTITKMQSQANINSETSALKQSRSVDIQEIIKAIQDQSNFIKNEKIIQIIKKRLNEAYYLKQRFDFGQNEAAYKESNYRLDADTDFLFQKGSWTINKNDEYIFINQEELKIQKGVLKLIVKQITSNILAGKSIMTMSLPVQIFYTKGMLEGVVDILGFTPKFLNDAAKSSDPVEQIKNIAAGFIFIFACHPKVCKPFNPILGETYQGIIGGIPIFAQQISHHPPISTFYMKTDKFQAYGNFDMHVDLGLNAAYSKNYGLFHVRIFESNTHFVIKYPDLEVGGIMFGDRTLKLKGKGFVFETTNNVYLEYSIGKQSKKLYEYTEKVKPSDFVGGIFKVRKEFADKIMKEDNKKSTDGAKFEDIVQKYSQITGKWYGNLYFDGVEYKSLMNGPYPLLPRRQKILLPSDSLFREDIIYKRWDDNKRSNEEKQILENLQRRDKKLREKHKK